MKKKKTTIPRHFKKIFVSFLTMLLVFNTLNLPVVQAEDNFVMLDGEYGDGRNDKEALDYDRATIDKKVSFGNEPGEYFIDLTVTGKQDLVRTSADVVIVYDLSNSMETNTITGTNTPRTKIAHDGIIQFINDVLNISNSDVNVALVPFGTSVMDGEHRSYLGTPQNYSYNQPNPLNYFSGFTSLANDITVKIPETLAGKLQGENNHGNHGGTFTQQAIRKAGELLSKSNAEHKFIVTVTDGLPTISYTDNNQSTGNGSEGQGTVIMATHRNRTIAEAELLKNDYILYSMGIGINKYQGVDKTNAQKVIDGLAQKSESPYSGNSETAIELAQKLQNISNSIRESVQRNNSIIDGEINDPMGEYFNLQGGVHFTPAKDSFLVDGDFFIDGNKPGLTNGVIVDRDGNGLKVNGLNLGEDETINIRYKVQIDTDKEGFETDKLYRTNGLTTLTPDSKNPDVKNKFPEPYASAKPITVEGIKIWDDYGNEDKRPDYITVDLVRNDAVIATKDVKPNEDGNWEYTFENQVWYDSEGNKIEYKVREHLLPGYHTSYDEGQIINKFKEPKISLIKEADKEELVVGETITYTFTSVNTGNVTLENIRLIDELEGMSVISFDTLNGNPIDNIQDVKFEPGDTIVATATYEVTQEDFDRGNVLNYAEITGTPVREIEGETFEDVSDDDVARVPGIQEPAINLIKKNEILDGNTISEVGQVVRYKFVISNIGNVTLTNITLEDEMLDQEALNAELANVELAPSDSITIYQDYTVTQEDLDKGHILNHATVEGTPPGNEPGNPNNPSDEDEVDVPTENNPAIQLEKDADKDGLTVGETITYTFTVTNTGNVTLKDINLTDELNGLSDIQFKTLNGETIDSIEGLLFRPDDVLVANATYTVLQTDVNKGFVYNKAHVEGTSVVTKEGEDPKKVTDIDDVEITEEMSADIKLDKLADKKLVSEVDEEIEYTFIVKNTGKVTLTDVSVEDDMLSKLGLVVELDNTTLEPGEIATGSVEYKVTQDDIDNGFVYNHATAEGTPPNYDPEDPDSEKPTDDDEVTVDVELNPSIKLEKVADKELVTEVGEEIVYTFKITNNGNTTLTDIYVRDDMLDNLELPVFLDKTTLAPGESTTAVVEGYKATQEDFDHGLIPNLAYVYGTPPSGDDDKVSDNDWVSVLTDSEANIQLDKVADKEEITEAGEIVTYTFTVTNTGKVTLSDITVEDKMLDELGINVELEKTTLAPGESTSVSVEYEVTQEDIDNGKVTNYAVAEGTPPKYDPEDPDSKKPTDDDEVEVPSKQSPSMTLEKTSDKEEVSKAGETITYTFTVTNTGNVILSHVSIDDEMLREHGIDVVLSKTTLAPGESISVSVEYEVTQDDIDQGVVRNVATVEGTPPGNEPGDPDNPGDEDEVDVPAKNNPAIHLEKVSDKKKVVNAGEFITYTFTVTNTGNVTLTGVEVEDDMLKDLGIEVVLEKTTLAPGETVKTSVKYEVTQDDIDKGFVYNHATAEGTPPNYDPKDPDGEKPTDEDEVEVPSEKNPSMTLTKLSDKETAVKVGDKVTYTFVVNNTGNVTLNGVKVNDKMLEDLGIKVLLDKNTLLPGESATGKAVYVITQEDVDRGYVYNHATTEGIPPGHTPDDPNNPVDEDEVTVPTVEDPSIKLKKYSNKDLVTKVGEIVEYTFEITNTGNITLRNITLEDIMLGGIIPLDVDTLKPGETYLITVDYKVKSSDLKQKNIVNTAKVIGETENGVEVFDFGEDIIDVAVSDASRLPLTGSPSLLLISFALLVTSGILLLISLRKRSFN